MASQFGLDIGAFEIVDVGHSHAAASTAVELVRMGKARLLMKGSLHSDELLGAVTQRENGLRTGRRISHVFVMDVPTHTKTLFITDAAVNIAPDLSHFGGIVPCGISEFGVTSMKALGKDLPLTSVDMALKRTFPSFIRDLSQSCKVT